MSSSNGAPFPFPVYAPPCAGPEENPLERPLEPVPDGNGDRVPGEWDTVPEEGDLPQRLERIEREAYEEAFRQGEKAGREYGEKAVVPLLEKLRTTLEDLATVRQTLLREAEREVVDLAFRLARAIVGDRVERSPDIVREAARKALSRMAEEGTVTLRVHPADVDTLWKERPALSRYLEEGAQLRVLPDESVARGGCLAVSDFSEVDATIDGQFEALREALRKMDGEPS
ncbi:MAG: hypothetical protein Kow00128_00570 [Deltaproteobacteria bacterium]